MSSIKAIDRGLLLGVHGRRSTANLQTVAICENDTVTDVFISRTFTPCNEMNRDGGWYQSLKSVSANLQAIRLR